MVRRKDHRRLSWLVASIVGLLRSLDWKAYNDIRQIVVRSSDLRRLIVLRGSSWLRGSLVCLVNGSRISLPVS